MPDLLCSHIVSVAMKDSCMNLLIACRRAFPLWLCFSHPSRQQKYFEFSFLLYCIIDFNFLFLVSENLKFHEIES